MGNNNAKPTYEGKRRDNNITYLKKNDIVKLSNIKYRNNSSNSQRLFAFTPDIINLQRTPIQYAQFYEINQSNKKDQVCLPNFRRVSSRNMSSAKDVFFSGITKDEYNIIEGDTREKRLAYKIVEDLIP